MKEDIQRSLLELQMRRSELMNEVNEISLQIIFLKENLEGIEEDEDLIEFLKLLRQENDKS